MTTVTRILERGFDAIKQAPAPSPARPWITVLALAVFLLGIGPVSGADPAVITKLMADSETGDPEALFKLGKAYASGDGVERDDAKAFGYYQKSAGAGHPKAQNNLGRMYLNGWGVKRDEQEAIKWFRLSAAQGAVLAQYTLGCMLADGTGMPKNLSEAMDWMKKAALQGYADAQFRLGQLYEFGGEGVTQDYREAARWFAMAAAQNHAGADRGLRAIYLLDTADRISHPHAADILLRWTSDTDGAQQILVKGEGQTIGISQFMHDWGIKLLQIDVGFRFAIDGDHLARIIPRLDPQCVLGLGFLNGCGHGVGFG